MQWIPKVTYLLLIKWRISNEQEKVTAGADFGGEPTGIEPPGYDFSAYRGGD